MMNSHFNLIKQRVSITDVCQAYGIQLNRAKKARCPFHKENDASFSVKDEMFSCFGCGKKGDVIKLVELLFNLKPIEALEKLNFDFHAGLDLEHKPEREEIIRYRQDQELKKQFEKWVKNSLNTLIIYFQELYFASKNPNDPLFDEAMQNIDKIDYYISWLENSPENFYKLNRKVVGEVERRRDKRNRIQTI